MTGRDHDQQVSGHYDRADLDATILQALQAAGNDLGPRFDPAVRNLIRNLAEQRIAIVEVVFEP
jgi:hypothetical protein